MLSAVHRLTKDQDFQKVMSKGRYAYSSLLTLKYLPNQRATSRIGFVVSTKIDKRAVVRNLLKRRCREIIRLGLGAIRPGYDIVLVPKKATVDLDYKNLELEVQEVFYKAGLVA